MGGLWEAGVKTSKATLRSQQQPDTHLKNSLPFCQGLKDVLTQCHSAHQARTHKILTHQHQDIFDWSAFVNT
ncbi:hypothetical protein FF38_09240 [Lucilia cuprina]|uniref:Uncharacterized protein n=1 Tax=Lucilia cuprina TaxID=7375 RepID=A0A0L0CN99_LUCCU|nr:hypothetical protein FF38_09240 [Lucilia cuprina]